MNNTKSQLPHKKGTFTRNNFRVCGDVAFIELTDSHGNKKAEAIIDTADLDYILSFSRWHSDLRKHTAYVSSSYMRGDESGKKIQWLHRVLGAKIGFHSNLNVDHINGNGLDNRRCNLRQATFSENNQNSRICNRMPISGYRNVHFIKDTGRYRVQMDVFKKRHLIGFFATAEEANAQAIAARKLLMKRCPENSLAEHPLCASIPEAEPYDDSDPREEDPEQFGNVSGIQISDVPLTFAPAGAMAAWKDEVALWG